jgi:hypothetical protein
MAMAMRSTERRIKAFLGSKKIKKNLMEELDGLNT